MDYLKNDEPSSLRSFKGTKLQKDIGRDDLILPVVKRITAGNLMTFTILETTTRLMIKVRLGPLTAGCGRLADGSLELPLCYSKL